MTYVRTGKRWSNSDSSNIDAYIHADGTAPCSVGDDVGTDLGVGHRAYNHRGAGNEESGGIADGRLRGGKKHDVASHDHWRLKVSKYSLGASNIIGFLGVSRRTWRAERKDKLSSIQVPAQGRHG